MKVYRAVKERWLAFGDDGSSSGSDVAKSLKCSPSYVQYLRRSSEIPERTRCTRCDFLHEDKIPVGEDGLCLWCRETVAGRDPRALYDSGAWQALMAWRGDRDPGDVLRQALRERMAQDDQSISGAAKQMGMTEWRLGNFLRGQTRSPGQRSLELFAQYLDVSVEEIQALLV